MERGVHERSTPSVADDLWAHDDVAELPGQPLREFLEPVERKREGVGRLVDAEVLALEAPALLGTDEDEPHLSCLDSLCGEHAPHELAGAVAVDLDAGAVLDLDLDHRRRAVPVSSVWSLYASTIRWTSLCRTTSRWSKCTNAIPSIEPRISCTWMSPDAWSRGRSTCVMSPVTTTFEPKPSRVRNICICSGVVFCASSRMMKLSLRVLCVTRKSSV